MACSNLSQPRNDAVAANAAEDGEGAGADGLSGESSAAGIDEEAGFYAAFFGKFAEIGFNTSFSEFRIRCNAIGEFAESFACAGSI